MYDVIVSGAGPGGATAARYLAKAGYAVALVDKEVFPRDKPCGGGFSYGILEDFPYLRSREKEFITGICRVGVLHSPTRRVVLRGRVSMATALRVHFDNALLEAAVDMGAEPILGRRVKSVRVLDNHVEAATNEGEIRGRVIIGAEGVGSITARDLNLHAKWPSTAITACRVAEVPANQETIRELFGDEYHFFANLNGKPGYGWIFPKRDTINIGLGIVGTHAQGLPRRFNLFVRLLKRIGLLWDSVDLSSARGALVPTGGTIAKTYSKRALLVGDSAGMVSPITGGGIHYAMVAGRIAAGVLLSALELDALKESDLQLYQHLWMQEFGKDFKPMLLAQRILTGPFTELLFEIASRDAKLQSAVSEAMAESSEGIDIRRILIQAARTVAKSAFHI